MTHMTREQIEFDFIMSGQELPDGAYTELAEKKAALMINGEMCISFEGLAVMIAYSQRSARDIQLAKSLAKQLQDMGEHENLERFVARLAEAGIVVD